jgi:hypothetical protein
MPPLLHPSAALSMSAASVATMYQLGFVFHAGSLTVPPRAWATTFEVFAGLRG